MANQLIVLFGYWRRTLARVGDRICPAAVIVALALGRAACRLDVARRARAGGLDARGCLNKDVAVKVAHRRARQRCKGCLTNESQGNVKLEPG